MASPARFRARLVRTVIDNGTVEFTFRTALSSDVSDLALQGYAYASVLVLPDNEPEPAVEAAAPEPAQV